MIYLLTILPVLAQEDMAISRAFSKYAVLQNATEVILSGKRLQPYKMQLFHSLQLSKPTAHQLKDIQQMVAEDTRQTLMHDESQNSNGSALTVTYQLVPKRRTKRYIFLRQDSEKLTLIYIEGKAEMSDLKAFFKKK